jgi:hypothetical protein
MTESEQQTTTTYDEDLDKYTKIDNLDEDDKNSTSNCFYLVSFVSPEGVMNCNTRALKIRKYNGRVTYDTYEEANRVAKIINARDKYFHVFVGESGKWMSWDPNPSDISKVEKEVWGDKKQQEVMDKLKEKEQHKLKELNALVGKKKDMIDNDKDDTKKRIQESVLEAADTVGNSTTNQEEQEVSKKKQHNNTAIKERLREKLRIQQEQHTQEQLTKTKTQEQLTTKLNNVKDKKEQSQKSVDELNNNINKLKDIINKAKSQTN